jgi:hypothetical protein
MSKFGEDLPFHDDEENPWDHAVPVNIRIGPPRVRPHVVPIAGKVTPLSKDDFVTSFLVVWQPSPSPPAHWVELLRAAPFGTQAVRARELHWNGKHLSIELVNEADVEAFFLEMPHWVEYANAEFLRGEHGPAVDALQEARRRARELENRLRR